jgi:hypothetical protein
MRRCACTPVFFDNPTFDADAKSAFARLERGHRALRRAANRLGVTLGLIAHADGTASPRTRA